MGILRVARIGHPVVRSRATEVSRTAITSGDIQRLIDDMVETMHDYDGVGLAAPQVHVGLRLAVFEVPASDDRTEEGFPLTVLVNPVLATIGDGMLLGLEGCLSIPDLRGEVPRHETVRLEALDRHGEPFTLTATGFVARVIQHECDHLDGNVYLDRMRDLRSLGFLRELRRHRSG